MTSICPAPEKYVPLHTHQVLDQIMELIAPDIPKRVIVSISNRPLLTRTLEKPIAIAVRYTNLNDTERTELKTSFQVHIVDNHTEDEINFPQFHPATGHAAVQILAWADINKYVKFKEELWKDLGTGLVDWRET
ncbi:MAG: hypothetical protein AAGF93_00380 [Cyanobacteria bacterium P01_H01_bin.105]